jgi:hypothetical protein
VQNNSACAAPVLKSLRELLDWTALSWRVFFCEVSAISIHFTHTCTFRAGMLTHHGTKNTSGVVYAPQRIFYERIQLVMWVRLPMSK